MSVVLPAPGLNPLLPDRGWRPAEGPRRTAGIPWTRDSRREPGL